METAKSLDHFKNEKVKSISHALGILNEAAQDSSEDIRRMVNKDFRRIKETFSNLKPEMTGAVHEIQDAANESVSYLKDRITDSSKEVARKVDAAARENPWVLAGSIALVLGVAGFFLGRKTSK